LGKILLLLAEGGCGGATGAPVVEGKGGNCTGSLWGAPLQHLPLFTVIKLTQHRTVMTMRQTGTHAQFTGFELGRDSATMLGFADNNDSYISRIYSMPPIMLEQL